MTSLKISQFNVSTSLSDSDLLTFVVGGTNKNITFADFKEMLGVTGSICQDGNPLGTPVLDKAGDKIKIRNIEASSGLRFNVTSENGIYAGLNMVQSSAGVKLIPDLGAEQYIVKTLVAGTGISLVDNGTEITINYTGS